MKAIELLSKAMDDNHRRIEDIRNTLGGAFLKLDSDTVIALGTEMKKIEADNAELGSAIATIEINNVTEIINTPGSSYRSNPAAEGIAAAKADAAKIAEASGVPCPDFLTEKEFEVLTAVYEVAGNCYDINDINQVSDLIIDNYSWFEAADVNAALPESKPEAVAALLGSLEKKGLIVNKYERINDVGAWQGIINENCHVSIAENLKK